MVIFKKIVKRPLWLLLLVFLFLFVLSSVMALFPSYTADITTRQTVGLSSGGGYGGVQGNGQSSAKPCDTLPFWWPSCRQATPTATPTPQEVSTATPIVQPTSPIDTCTSSGNWLEQAECVQQGTPTDIALKIGIDTLKSAALAMSFIKEDKANFVLETPASMTYENPFLLQQWTSFQVAALSLLLVVVAWNSLRLVLKSSIIDYSDALEMVPKGLFAFLAACFSMTFFRFVLQLNNAFCAQLHADISEKLLSFIDPNSLSHVGLLYVLAAFFYTVLLIVLSLVAAARLAALCVLGVTGPLGMLAFASKETESIGRFWLSALISTTAIQFLQVLILKVGLFLLFDNLGHSFIGLLTACGVLLLALEVPKLLGQAALYSLQNTAGKAASLSIGAVKTIISFGRVVA